MQHTTPLNDWNEGTPAVPPGHLWRFLVSIERIVDKEIYRSVSIAEFANAVWLEFPEDYEGDDADDQGGKVWNGWLQEHSGSEGDPEMRDIEGTVTGWMGLPEPRFKPKTPEVTNRADMLLAVSVQYKDAFKHKPTVTGSQWTYHQRFSLALAAQDGFHAGAAWMSANWPEHHTDRLTASKTASIMDRNKYRLTGFILTHRETGDRALIESSAVRWNENMPFQIIMRPPQSQRETNEKMSDSPGSGAAPTL